MAINVSADPGVIVLSGYATRSTFPTASRDATLDTIFDCSAHSARPSITLAALGTWLNVNIEADPGVITLAPLGSWPSGFSISASPGVITLTPLGDTVIGAAKSNWLKWSDIGNLDFTIGRSNVAGEMPLDWSGYVYMIKKLNNKPVAYGANGVTIMIPKDKFFGKKTVHNIGLYSYRAMAGTDNVHYFVDSSGKLWKHTEDLTLLDYSEYLSEMSNIVLSYDAKNELLYICDGNYGYVYSARDESLGTCSPNITGVGVKDGTVYLTSSSAISTPNFELCTDIYDFETRKFKTLRSIEVSTDLTTAMQGCIEYRIDKAGSFSQTAWTIVNPNGETYLPCYGVEFRVRLRVQSYEYFEIDYLKFNGLIHHYSYTEHMLGSLDIKRTFDYGS